MTAPTGLTVCPYPHWNPNTVRVDACIDDRNGGRVPTGGPHPEHRRVMSGTMTDPSLLQHGAGRGEAEFAFRKDQTIRTVTLLT